MGVKNSDDLRKAHDTIQPSVIEVQQKIGQSQGLFKAMSALRKRHSIWYGMFVDKQSCVISL